MTGFKPRTPGIGSDCSTTEPHHCPYPMPCLLLEMAGRWCHRFACLVLTIEVCEKVCSLLLRRNVSKNFSVSYILDKARPFLYIMGKPGLFLFIFISFSKQKSCRKTDGFRGFELKSSSKGEHADHLTTTTAKRLGRHW